MADKIKVSKHDERIPDKNSRAVFIHSANNLSIISFAKIEKKDKEIPFNKEKFNVANHIRALLDMIEAGYFKEAQGMNNDYICNDKYNLEIFKKVLMLKENKNFIDINKFMLKEYGKKWAEFLRKENSNV